MITFGQRLKALREKRELSQGELGKRFTLSQSTIAYYELNKKQPNQDTLNKMADFFEVTTDYLLGRTDNPSQTLSEEARELIDNLELTDAEIRNKFPFEVDGRPVTDEEFKWFIASVRSKRSMEEK